MDSARQTAAEALGTGFLVAAVVGSGIMGEQLAGGNVALALLANTIATAATLVALIVALGPISGAHFNPAVSLTESLRGRLAWNTLPARIAAQVAGGVLGTLTAHAMFGQAVLQVSTHPRAGAAQVLSEFVATFGLVFVIRACARFRADAVAAVVGLYIVGAYWFTASTSFANPAVTIARTMTGTFAGIRPLDAPAFIAAQFAGACVASAVSRWLLSEARPNVSVGPVLQPTGD